MAWRPVATELAPLSGPAAGGVAKPARVGECPKALTPSKADGPCGLDGAGPGAAGAAAAGVSTMGAGRRLDNSGAVAEWALVSCDCGSSKSGRAGTALVRACPRVDEAVPALGVIAVGVGHEGAAEGTAAGSAVLDAVVPPEGLPSSSLATLRGGCGADEGGPNESEAAEVVDVTPSAVTSGDTVTGVGVAGRPEAMGAAAEEVEVVLVAEAAAEAASVPAGRAGRSGALEMRSMPPAVMTNASSRWRPSTLPR